MPVALMSLGQNVFYTPLLEQESPGYDTLTRDTAFTWVPQGRLNAPLAMQYTGQGQDTVTIEGKLFPGFFGGPKTLDAIRASGSAGKPLTLIRYFPAHDANGVQIQGIQAKVLGTYVIMRIRVIERDINSAGAPNMVEFSLELQAFGEDAATAISTGSSVTQGTIASQAASTTTPTEANPSTATPH